MVKSSRSTNSRIVEAFKKAQKYHMTTLINSAGQLTARRLQEISRLRIVVAFLGEKSQHNWWSSDFLSGTASAFLSPVFNKTTMLARYQGVKEAACLIHDERIGVGQRVFHLFRLPASIERSLFGTIQDISVVEVINEDVQSREAAEAALHQIAEPSSNFREGPLQVGSADDLDHGRWLAVAAGSYEAAFKAGSQSFPYLAGDA